MSIIESNRVTPHAGKTARMEKENIKILIDAELKDVGLCAKITLMLHCCSSFDRERSYLFLRENSLESNVVFNACCGCCTFPDFVTVNYFDRAPYAESCKMAPIPFCCFCTTEQPKLEIIEPGCMICCVKVNLCGDTQVILMPFENFPFPCCCCSNRVNACDNCFGLCGPITGNPKTFLSFFPQPTDPVGFVKVSQAVMLGRSDASEFTNVTNPAIAVAVQQQQDSSIQLPTK